MIRGCVKEKKETIIRYEVERGFGCRNADIARQKVEEERSSRGRPRADRNKYEQAGI
jgi:hypothetical protein